MNVGVDILKKMISKKDFMLCEKIEEDKLNEYTNGNWLGNIKYDGERIIIIKKNDEIFLVNRNGRIKNNIYREVIEDFKQMPFDFILDSEIITEDNLFNSLQHRINLNDEEKIKQAIINYPIKCMVFDIINLKGKDLRNMPLNERVLILEELFSEFKFNKVEMVMYYTDLNGLYSFAKSKQLEGIVLKAISSNYESRRSNSWLKLKFFKITNLKAISYEINNSGIRVEDEEDNACQIQGIKANIVREEIDNKGYCDIVVQYLEKTKNNRLRFISYKGLKNEN